jgi:hypothetical protein
MGWIAQIIRGGIGGIQMGMAIEELKSLPDARTYSLNQDLATATALARRGSQQGMTPQERAVAEQSIGTAQSRAQRAMEQRGLGNLAAAVTQVNTTDAFNRLEAQNQQIKRDYLGAYAQLGSKVQALENANVTSFNQQLAMQQRELGMAAQQGFSALGGTGAALANAFDKEQIDKWKSQYDQKQVAKAQTELAQGEAQSSFSADLMGDNRQVGEPIFSGDTLKSVESSPEYGMLSPETQTAISQGFSSDIDSSGFDASTMNMNLSAGFDTAAVEGMYTGASDFSSVGMPGPVASTGN